ncbi:MULTISPECIES: AI-2E family transporter [unclassified Methanosarcina]|uniref:AI-2E family transporter n=1 Tax=unclassified Methanosarcina TaxID=2644672 RepID=UPI00061573FD|nr:MULTISPECIES: AI-2E family transporter [unclassified Methanosarcina]AKB18236.1 Putative transport protein [Methanosarcina sp. WWM596]AKB21561.1 Putative transport protein [Methanosarcina sp. WH1]
MGMNTNANTKSSTPAGSMPAKILLYTTAVVILTIGMREVSSILTTVIFSIFIALLFTPLVRWLKQKGVPGWLSIALAISLFTVIILVLGAIVIRAAFLFGNQIPIYQDQLTVLVNGYTKYIPSYEGFSLQSIVRGIVSITISLMISIVNELVNASATVGIIIVTAAFMLIDATSMPERVNQETENKSELQLNLGNFSRKLVKFIVIRAEVNLITSFTIALLLFIGDIEYAVLWGVLIFLLSYIPYIGLVIASIPPIMLALFKYGPLGALAVIVIIVVVDALTENVLFPSMMGKGLQLSPAFLFVALLYWNFVLGLGGVLLSIPLTLVLKMLLESFKETKWLARLMGPAENTEDS